MSAPRTAWLRQAAPADPGAPTVVFFPHAGGSAGFFAPYARALTPHVRVLAVQYPGRLDRRREPCARDLRELAQGVADALAGESSPAALFGHSMGGLVAFETLRTGRVRAGRLLVSGSRAPSRTRVDPALLHDDGALLEQVLGLGGTARELRHDEALRELVLPPLRADFQALSRYAPRYGATVDCPLTALVGDRDPLVPVADARAWSAHTTGPFELKVLPGDHFYLTPALAEVAETIRAVLVPA